MVAQPKWEALAHKRLLLTRSKSLANILAQSRTLARDLVVIVHRGPAFGAIVLNRSALDALVSRDWPAARGFVVIVIVIDGTPTTRTIIIIIIIVVPTATPSTRA